MDYDELEIFARDAAERVDDLWEYETGVRLAPDEYDNLKESIFNTFRDFGWGQE